MHLPLFFIIINLTSLVFKSNLFINIVKLFIYSKKEWTNPLVLIIIVIEYLAKE